MCAVSTDTLFTSPVGCYPQTLTDGTLFGAPDDVTYNVTSRKKKNELPSSPDNKNKIVT